MEYKFFTKLHLSILVGVAFLTVGVVVVNTHEPTTHEIRE